MKKRKSYGWLIMTLLPLTGAALYLPFGERKDLADRAVAAFSRPARDALGELWSRVPFSGMEAFIALVGAVLVILLLRLLFCWDGRTLRRLGALLLLVAWLLTGYLWLWGIDYRASSFRDKTGFTTHPLTGEELQEAAAFFVAQANTAAASVPRDGEGRMTGEIEKLLDASLTVYDTLDSRFPPLAAQSRRPKAMLFSRLMSHMGFTGVFFPYTAESNINTDQTLAFIPATIAHELAHQRGVTSEQEANFLGVTAAVTSGDPAYVYSGWLTGAVYLMNALYRADPAAWTALYATFSESLRTDWEANAAYWAALQSPVTEASEKVYDTYLRANGQTMGMQSYGACVDLLVAYYEQGGYTAKGE